MNDIPYTGITRRLDENEVYHEPRANTDFQIISGKLVPRTKRIAERYRVESDDQNWYILDATKNRPIQNAAQHADSDAQRLDTSPAMGIQDSQHSAVQAESRRQIKVTLTDQPYTQINPITDTIMPVLCIAILTLAIVAIGGYQSIQDIPSIFATIPIIGLIAYILYRINPVYERNGRALEKFMRATHNQDGTVNRQNMLDLMRNRVDIVEEE